MMCDDCVTVPAIGRVRRSSLKFSVLGLTMTNLRLILIFGLIFIKVECNKIERK